MLCSCVVLRACVGVKRVVCAIGGSMGGMQVLEWTFVKQPQVSL